MKGGYRVAGTQRHCWVRDEPPAATLQLKELQDQSQSVYQVPVDPHDGVEPFQPLELAEQPENESPLQERDWV